MGYEEHMRQTEETLEMTFKKKISDLEVQLAVQMSAVKSTEDITELKIELEKYKKKIEELDSNNRDLRTRPVSSKFAAGAAPRILSSRIEEISLSAALDLQLEAEAENCLAATDIVGACLARLAALGVCLAKAAAIRADT